MPIKPKSLVGYYFIEMRPEPMHGVIGDFDAIARYGEIIEQPNEGVYLVRLNHDLERVPSIELFTLTDIIAGDWEFFDSPATWRKHIKYIKSLEHKMESDDA